MKLHEKLYKLRKEKGITQAEVAAEMQLSRQAISRWEMGLAVPSTENLKHLSLLYGVSVDYLLTEEEAEPFLNFSAEKFLSVDKSEKEEEGESHEPPEEQPVFEEESSSVQIKKSAPKRRKPLVIILVAVVGIAAGITGFIWWSLLPAQQFSFWLETPTEDPERTGIRMTVNEVARNDDGSGWIDYILENDSDETKYWGRLPRGSTITIKTSGTGYRSNQKWRKWW